MEHWTRRKFFATTLAGGALAGATDLFGKSLSDATPFAPDPTAKRPVIISSANGLHALGKGMDILKSGGDTLDAVVAAVTVVEDDPNDDSVGYGGLPNEEGVVELDASVMHGPTRRAGSVGSVQRIKNVARLAKTVMERTNHTMIVGDGARRFAVDEGFEEMNLLTEHSRKIWLAWKARTSFNWRPGIDSPEWKATVSEIFDNDPAQIAYAMRVIKHPPTGTINCLSVNEKGEVSGTTTTSGLAWKIPGRVGDSPIIGAGLFVDGDVGGAGSTGKGEENIKISGGHTVVEMMRKGMKPADACLEASGPRSPQLQWRQTETRHLSPVLLRPEQRWRIWQRFALEEWLRTLEGRAIRRARWHGSSPRILQNILRHSGPRRGLASRQIF